MSTGGSGHTSLPGRATTGTRSGRCSRMTWSTATTPMTLPVHGREAVVESWLGESDNAAASTRDDAGTYEATYRCVAVDGDLAVATGSTTYTAAPGGPAEKVFDNCFVLRFDPAGLCCEFTEWYMERPDPS